MTGTAMLGVLRAGTYVANDRKKIAVVVKKWVFATTQQQLEARKEVQSSAIVTTSMPNVMLKLVCIVEAAGHMLIAYERHDKRMSDVLLNADGSLSGIALTSWVRAAQSSHHAPSQVLSHSPNVPIL